MKFLNVCLESQIIKCDILFEKFIDLKDKDAYRKFHIKQLKEIAQV
jgi:hypothetical protein